MGAFQDRVVWITGASAGIGRELALAFADEGAQVAVSARRAERLEEVVAEVERRGRRGLSVPCDVTDESSVERAVAAIVEQFGRLDVAIANAGFGVGGAFEEISVADWRRQFELNVVGLVSTALHALPLLRASRGRLVLIGSVAGLLPTPGSSPYGASKAAVRSIGQSLAVELHGSGVSCTTVLPGFVVSEIGQVDRQGVYRPDWEDRRPTRLMWPTDRAARAIVEAVRGRKREFVFTGHGRIGAFVGRHAPGLAHFLLSRIPAARRG